METYSDFAKVYDMYMDNIPYKEWSDYIEGLLKENGIENGLILDLGCGTGSLTELLAEKGYDMIGIDNSEEMLNVALDKKEESGHDILYLNQDMREFELYGTVRAVVSICDSVNYIIDEKDLSEVFRLVNNYLDIGGLFIFDLNTIYKYKTIGDSVIAENRSDGSFIWENTFYEEENINEYELTLYIKDENGKYDRVVENHLQRAYSLEEIKRLIKESGMELVAVYDECTREPVHEKTERMYVIARECGKANKLA